MISSNRSKVAAALLSKNLLSSTASVTSRSYTFSNMGGGGADITFADSWPVTKPNTLINICPQGERMVVERLGKLYSIQPSGWFIAIPFIDNIAYRVDMRERALDITPQAAITKDNVSVDVSGNVYVQFVDPQLAAYGAKNPLYAVRQHAQSAMRSAIGEMELDEILHGRAQLNTLIKGALQEAAVAWGLDVKRYEITEITPDRFIAEAMDKQAAAERYRREKVLEAEGEKSKAMLESEGIKIKLTNESEGDLIKVTNEATASAKAVVMEAQAQAQALSIVASEMAKPGGAEAAQLALAIQYVKMYGEMGSKSNTMMFNERPADVNALLVQASMAFKGAGEIGETAKNIAPPPSPSFTTPSS